MASSASQAQADAISKVSHLRTRIEAALDQRGRHYACYFTFAIRYEKDDTNAEKNMANFQTIFKMLSLSIAMKTIVSSFSHALFIHN